MNIRMRKIYKNEHMAVKFFCTAWGKGDISWTEFSSKVKEAGYDGIEWGMPKGASSEELEQVGEATEKYRLNLILQHWDTSEPEFGQHFDTYAAWFEKVLSLKPEKINTQTGKDYFTFEQNMKLIDHTFSLSRASNIDILHETHRGRFSFAAHITSCYLARMPELRITLDASHWVNVSESYLDDQAEAMDLAIARTGHIHARVGYPEGPQITDPRLEQWQPAVDRHLVWWDQVIERKKDGETMTITPEFGPYPYMMLLPDTQQPVADQWEINAYMLNLLKNRYEHVR